MCIRDRYLVKKDVQFLEKIHQVIEENMDDSDFNIDTIASGIGLSLSLIHISAAQKCTFV